MSEPSWSVAVPPQSSDIEAWVRALRVPPLVAASLLAREPGLLTAPSDLATPLEPLHVPGIEEAVHVLHDAVRSHRRIVVHGDYDADGMTGTAILALGLRGLGADVRTFLPNRLTHGYGIAPELVDEHAKDADVFVTVDCGVNDVEQVDRLRRSGMDVIVTDHHTPGPAWPDATIVHPRWTTSNDGGARGGHGAKGVEPTGAGVAFHLLWHLHLALGRPDPLEYADLAAIGTIADVAPLLGTNRALVKEGLSRIETSAWPGVRALARTARIGRPPTARDVAFGVAPRLNAAGRLGLPDVGLAALMTADPQEASHLAAILDARNDERKRIQEAMFQEALDMVDDAPAIVVAHDAWHPGVMGIVASKLLERFHKPVFISAQGQGSVRSTPGISAIEVLRAVSDHLVRFGGHTAAAGFRVEPGAFESFRAAVHRHVDTLPRHEPSIEVDAVVDPLHLDEDLWRGIAALEPFGEGLRPPTFALSGPATRLRSVGREGDHLQIHVGDVKGVVFGEGRFAHVAPKAATVQVAGHVVDNAWNGRRSIEFQGKHVRIARPLRPSRLEREDPGAPDFEYLRGKTVDVDDPGSWTIVDGASVDVTSLQSGSIDEPDAAWASWAVEGHRLLFDLDDAMLDRLVHAARDWPTVHEVRRTLVGLRTGRRILASDVAHARAVRALDAMGLSVDGRTTDAPPSRVDPYACDAVVHGVMVRHRVLTFVGMYRHADDRAFDATIRSLYGSTTSRP